MPRKRSQCSLFGVRQGEGRHPQGIEQPQEHRAGDTLSIEPKMGQGTKVRLKQCLHAHLSQRLFEVEGAKTLCELGPRRDRLGHLAG